MANDTPTPDHIRALRKQILDAFSDEEFKILCVDIGLRYDNLGSETLEGKINDVIGQLNRLGRLPDLVQACQRERPRLSWNFPSDHIELAQSFSSSGQPMKQIIFIGVLMALVGVLVNLTSNFFQRLIGETISIWPALLLVLATIIFSVIVAYIQSGKSAPKLGDVNWSFTFQGLAIVIAMIFGAWQLAGPSVFTSSILGSWGVMAGLPLAVAFLITPAENLFRAGLLPHQQTALTYEKFFGAYIAAFIGQFFALMGLLILDIVLGVWQGWPTIYKFVFWFASQLAIVLLALRGTSVSVKYWRNVIQRDPEAKGKSFGTLVLALAFPFFLYPVIVGGTVLVLPTLRSYPILIVGLLVVVLIIIGQEMSKDKKQ